MSEILSILNQDKRHVFNTTSDTGHHGEMIAASYLKSCGYRLVLSNFKVPIGRNSKGVAATGEIDIVALDEETLCFVEVKTRTSDLFAAPLASVTRRKQRQITRTARVYRRVFNVYDMPCRFDVVSIVLARDSEPAIELIKGFWSESSFRKKVWNGDIY
ncbi:MAG: YraN family protein [Acidobacteria bacterium]|nr:MAG: YraN family protein [Acidobacteriota bacterium]